MPFGCLALPRLGLGRLSEQAPAVGAEDAAVAKVVGVDLDAQDHTYVIDLGPCIYEAYRLR